MTTDESATTVTKRCTKCGEIKPITEFHKRTASPDGHQIWCKHCTAIANARPAEKRAETTPPRFANGTAPHLLKDDAA